jgi:uncharacterized membrane protein YcaP (DUF421 family)
MLKKIMLKERIDEDEIHAIVREKGYPSIEGIDAIVLETDGSLTVIKDTNSQKNSSMQKVKNWSH